MVMFQESRMMKRYSIQLVRYVERRFLKRQEAIDAKIATNPLKALIQLI
jgi:hypothetical protein